MTKDEALAISNILTDVCKDLRLIKCPEFLDELVEICKKIDAAATIAEEEFARHCEA